MREDHLGAGDVGAEIDANAAKREVAHGGQWSDVHLVAEIDVCWLTVCECTAWLINCRSLVVRERENHDIFLLSLLVFENVLLLTQQTRNGGAVIQFDKGRDITLLSFNWMVVRHIRMRR